MLFMRLITVYLKKHLTVKLRPVTIKKVRLTFEFFNEKSLM